MRWQFKAVVAGGVLGLIILALSFPSYWPPTHWKVLPRMQLIEKGRQIARHFDVDADKWQALSTVRVSKQLSYYTAEHPGEAEDRDLSPLELRITYHSPDRQQSCEVGFNSAGMLTYWKPPEKSKANQRPDSDDSAAKIAFTFMAGAEATSYQNSGRRMGDEAREETYTWKRTPVAKSDLRETISVDTKDSAVESIQRKTYLASVDEDSSTGDRSGYWDVFDGIFGLISTVSTIAFFGIYMLWLVRKAISHNFPARVAVVSYLVMIAAELMKTHGSAAGNHFTVAFFLAITIFCLVAVGRSISAAGRAKWMSLEQLFGMAPVGRSTGGALAAGMTISPLLAAIPFLIVSSRMFPHSWVLPHGSDLLYSPSPLAAGFNATTYVYLAGFFGFGVAAMERRDRYRWLRWLVILPLGSVFFADEALPVSGPLAAALVAGLLILGVFWFLWQHFDLLAVLTAQLASGLILSIFLLQQKGFGFGSLAGALVCVALVAAWCYWRGQEAMEGDPRATLPALSGFRAEREKLRAEFSVAARAQQDMLPRTPPRIPGYTVAVSCTPSLDVGGDLYDFLYLKDGRIGIGVADVSGKGVPAALYMTLTKGLLAAVTKDTSELAQVVEEVNRHLYGVTRKKVFVTMVLGFLDAERRLLQCARSGHNPVVWRRKSQELTELVSPGGLGLGITASRIFGKQLQIAEMQLSEGDAVVFYSDGITEAMNSSLEQFGEERLMTAVEKTDSMDAAATHNSILGEVRQFLGGVHPQDDMTLVVLRVSDAQ